MHLALSACPNNASLLYLIDGEQLTLYEHCIGEERQPGWYFGGYNTTTWGAKRYEASPTSYFYSCFYLDT